jgi:hypothetical protein
LSEFSQADALAFEAFAKSAFGDAALKKLVKPPEQKDIRELIYLEAHGLIQGASGMGLERTIGLNEDGFGFIFEGDLAIVYRGQPNFTLNQEIIALTPLGQELLSLVPSSQPLETAKAVALASRVPEINECFLGLHVTSEKGGTIQPIEFLWFKESEQEPIVEGSVG